MISLANKQEAITSLDKGFIQDTIVDIEVKAEYLIQFVYDSNYTIFDAAERYEVEFASCEINSEGIKQLEAGNASYELI